MLEKWWDKILMILLAALLLPVLLSDEAARKLALVPLFPRKKFMSLTHT